MFIALLSFTMFAYPWWKIGTKAGWVGTVAWVVLSLNRSWNLVSPTHMKLLKRNYAERKLALYKLIQDMHRAPTMAAVEVERFQQEALHLIATYVRDHRLDTSATQIFANLLIEAGDDLVVVARDRAHRIGNARYSKVRMLATLPLESGEPSLTGDVYADFPETPKGKPYRSILAIPVRSGSEIVGVVSIDSSRLYHFDRFQRDLVESLMPYVALLGWTLRRSVPTTCQVSIGLRRS